MRNDIYNLLKNVRREVESFSDVIGRLLKIERRNYRLFWGFWEIPDLWLNI
ncbi:antitoxin VapB family protein [Methanosarcina sp.]|uniref:antitoxin VapB family protein n=1 Tax=Methanosarcina sp. TaxID=2213 RepID=UPI003C7563EB